MSIELKGLLNGSYVPVYVIGDDTDDAVIKFRSSKNGNDYDAKIVSHDGGVTGVFGHAFLSYSAGRHAFIGWDGNEQARISTTPLAVNFVEFAGGTTNKGANIFTDGADANVPLNLTVKGTAGFSFGNESGALFNIGDPGALITSNATHYPGTALIPPGVDTSGADWAVTRDRNIVLKVSNPSPSNPATGYVKINAGTGATPFPGLTVDGANANIQLALSSKGTSLVSIGNSGQGNVAYFSAGGLIANRWSVQANATGQEINIGPSSDSESTAIARLKASSTQLWKSDQMAFQNVIAKQGYSIVVATAAGNHTVGAGKSGIVYNPAGTIASFTETLPASPIDGQECDFTTTQTITAYTLSPNSGQSIASGAAPTTLTPSTPFKMRYVSSITTWVRSA
ncbi:hypothetical protein [Bradyrhizobium sp. DASA03007]|uniref:hypothetical protein n=1 Tax=unclassified Bradyrhizobium TaxID=2631580 RepID=UPI003F6E85AB